MFKKQANCVVLCFLKRLMWKVFKCNTQNCWFFQLSTEHSTLYCVHVQYEILNPTRLHFWCKLHQSFDAFKRGKKRDCWSVDSEKKDPKANPYLPNNSRTRLSKSLSSLCIHAGGPRREAAVLLCNWGLRHHRVHAWFQWVTHGSSSTCPAVLRPCFCRMHLLWSVYCFLRSVLVLIWQEMQCVRCIMISYMSVFSVLRRSRAGNLHAALTIEGIWYWLRSVWDFDKCELGNGWETLGVSREAVVLTDLTDNTKGCGFSSQRRTRGTLRSCKDLRCI